MATVTVYDAPSGEKAVDRNPVGQVAIHATWNPATYATNGVAITAALVNTGLATYGAQFTVSAVTLVLIGNDEVDNTYYSSFDRANAKILTFQAVDEAEASAGALDVEFPCTIIATLA